MTYIFQYPISKKIPNYIFKNDRVTFKSYLNEFSFELFEEFDLRAKKNWIRFKNRRSIEW